MHAATDRAASAASVRRRVEPESFPRELIDVEHRPTGARCNRLAVKIGTSLHNAAKRSRAFTKCVYDNRGRASRQVPDISVRMSSSSVDVMSAIVLRRRRFFVAE